MESGAIFWHPLVLHLYDARASFTWCRKTPKNIPTVPVVMCCVSPWKWISTIYHRFKSLETCIFSLNVETEIFYWGSGSNWVTNLLSNIKGVTVNYVLVGSGNNTKARGPNTSLYVYENFWFKILFYWDFYHWEISTNKQCK